MNKRKIYDIVIISLSLLMMLDLFLTLENVEGVDEGGFGALGRGVEAIVCRIQIISDV